MHRSGTSCLTGTLQEAGIFLGDCHTWNPYNQKGNRENQRVVDINDAVLAENGGSWDQPPDKVTWSKASLEAAHQLLADHGDADNFGFKDPRTLLVLDGWRSVYPTMQLVGIFRHPLAVAGSLARRDGMAMQDALALWYQYNRRLYRYWQQTPFPVLCFDDPVEDFNHKVAVVIRESGIGDAEHVGEFYDTGLKSERPRRDQALPWRVRWLLRRLQRIAR
jgi:hypothetical protein